MNVYKVGLDIGSTTTKMVVLDKDGTTVLFSGYKRHQAKIQECLLGFLYQIKEQLGDIPLSFHITGSVGMGISEKCSLPFVQEVVAATNYVCREHPHTATMIDIGGEDAKVVFFLGRTGYRPAHEWKLRRRNRGVSLTRWLFCLESPSTN